MLQNRRIKDIIAKQAMLGLAVLVGLLVFLIAFGLFTKSRPILETKHLSELLFSTRWRPSEGAFGFAPFIAGTVWVTVVAMVLAVPPSLFSAIYLAEYAPKKVQQGLKPLLDMLSGVSPVIFGVFGVLVVVPLIKEYALPWANRAPAFIPFLHSENFTGFSILAGGIVLALMVFPIMTSVAEEVIASVPQEARESSFALGATKWETIKYVVLKKARAGIIAAIILGLSRAFGETIAVLMVIGNVAQMPKSVFDAAYPLPALIANNYGEMMSIPLYDSALLLAAMILLAVTVFFNVIAWSILLRIERQHA